MKVLTLVALFLVSALRLSAQQDSLLTLRIIDADVCYVKRTSALNFSYYFENHSSRHMVVVDYYEPCFWEFRSLVPDSTNTTGLFLVIRDDSGRVVLPRITADSALLRDSERFSTDSLGFFDGYDQSRYEDYHFHTRVLRPKDVLINLYNLRLNRRKCFYKGTFSFDPKRKYRLSLHYIAREDIHHLARKSILTKDDELFTGELVSNEVELCFR